MSRMSVATISQPEFINLQPLDINPLMSKCEIKVLYVGENRNRSYISKEVATEMAKTLRGAPIVGYYKEEKEDFRDHGEKVTWDGDGIKFESQTRPYGFVSPDSEVWFQTFKDTDDFGNEVEREYLMTTGYLWTGQYEEANLPIDEGRPQSMELEEKTLNGHWAENSKSGLEFFIINDAIFSKLCILGEDVEPCFEGANVTAPEVSTSFTLDNNFKNTLYKMMQELKFALEGGQSMAKENETPEVGTEETPIQEENAENFSANEDNSSETSLNENEVPTEGQENSFSKSSEDDEEKKESEQDDDNDDSDTENKEDDEEKKKYTALQEQYAELESKFSALQTEYQSLVDFKNQIENQQKDALINQFYMLDDEDKQDVIVNKSKYTLDEIEAKLSVIYTKKQLAESQNTNPNKKENKSIFTYEMNESGNGASSVPEWVQAASEVQKTLNY